MGWIGGPLVQCMPDRKYKLDVDEMLSVAVDEAELPAEIEAVGDKDEVVVRDSEEVGEGLAPFVSDAVALKLAVDE